MQNSPEYEQFDKQDYMVKVTHKDQVVDSMFLTMLKSLRWGTDLISMVSPSFLCSGKSLLENNADYLRPIPELLLLQKQDAEQRFFTMLKYVMIPLASVNRKGFEGIKPFNPILGELFFCKWSHPDASCTEYIGEQVSHHPPISCGRISNDVHNLQIDIVMQPTAKFLGNKIEVKMLGDVQIYYKDECYVYHLPSFVGKGLFLGESSYEANGCLLLTCSKTGYYAEIKFGKGGSVKGYVYSDKQKLFKVHGALQSIVQVTSKTINVTKELYNIAQHEPMYKQVANLDAQLPNESRRVWEKVTKALWKRDFEQASKAKHEIEEYQRKHNKQDKFVPRFFKPVPGKFVNSVAMYSFDSQDKQVNDVSSIELD